MSTSEFERIAEQIVRDRMTFYGYTPEETAAAEAAPPHTAQCEDYGMGNYLCEDEDGRPNHPDRDELDRTAELIVWVLEHPALTQAAEAGAARPRPSGDLPHGWMR